MHLRNVEIFCEVVQRRSFSKGAEAQNVSQSSASQAVHMLEKRLGTRLIDRSKRPFELTSTGEVYYEGCRELLDAFRAIEDRVRQIENKVAGRVRVAAIYSVGLSQIDASVQRFEMENPETQVEVEYLHPDEVYSHIQSDQADLGLVSFPRNGGEISNIPWQEQEVALVVPSGHRFASRQSIRLPDIDGEDFVAFTPELKIGREIDRQLKRAKVAVNVVHEFDNIENIKRAIEVGYGISLLPIPTLGRETQIGSLVAVPIEDVKLCRPLGIVHKRHKRLSNAARKFADLLLSEPSSPVATVTETNGERRSHSSKRKRTAVSR